MSQIECVRVSYVPIPRAWPTTPSYIGTREGFMRQAVAARILKGRFLASNLERVTSPPN